MKKQILFFFYTVVCKAFLLAHLQSSDASRKFAQIERLKAEGLYEEALNLCQEISPEFVSISPLLLENTKLSEAQCLLELKQPQAVIDLLDHDSNSSWQHKYLLGLAYRQKKEYQLALNILNTIDLEQQIQWPEITLEKGINYFYLEHFQEAFCYFKKILYSPSQTIPYHIAQFYLIQIALNNKDLPSAKKIFLDLKSLPDDSSFLQEKIYLEGMIYFQQGDYLSALHSLEKVYLQKSPCSQAFQIHILTILFKLIEHTTDQNLMLDYFKKAETILKSTPNNSSNDFLKLLYVDFYLLKKSHLNDLNAHLEAQKILDTTIFQTEEGKRQAKLKQGNILESRPARIRFYDDLISTEAQSDPILMAQAWYFKGLNEVEEGLAHKQLFLLPSTADMYFEKAAFSFSQAYEQFHAAHLYSLANEAQKNQILANFYQSSEAKKKQALQLLYPFIATNSDSADLLIFAGTILTSIPSPSSAEILKAKEILNPSPSFDPSSNEKILKFQGLLFIKENDWLQASEFFADFLKTHPDSTETSEILYWMAECASQLNQELLRQEYLKQVYLRDSNSPFAAPAYFKLYSYREYMQGKKSAIKHLEAMSKFFPNTPLLISAYYLIGLNHLKNPIKYEGKVNRKKDEIAAIDAFQLAESKFDELLEKQLLKSEEVIYFTHIKYQSMLERALANLAIANQSTSTKRRIYLEYAQDVFQQLIQTLTSQTYPQNILFHNDLYPKVLQEAEFGLAKTYIERQKIEEAQKLFDLIIQKTTSIHQPTYLLLKTYYEKGLLAQKENNPSQALAYFLKAATINHVHHFLSPNEKLDLWIQLSQCYQELEQLDEAMLMLSKVVNDETISSLRVKAMYLRAEIYEKQGRPELALKQLEATARKGGEWSQKAKEKLEKNYVY